jgi:hypothetical protein
MTFLDDSHEDMERLALDLCTADRLLSGALEPEDAPHRYGEVASLLRIASGVTTGPRYGEEAAVATVVWAIRSNHRPAPARPRRAHARLKGATAGIVAAFTLTGGLAAANALPSPAQKVAADALGVVGVHVPSPATTPAPTRQKPAETPASHPGVSAVTTMPTPGRTTVTVQASTPTTVVSASTTSVSVASQPAASAGRTQATTSPTTVPQSPTQSSPAPKASGGTPTAAPAPTSTTTTMPPTQARPARNPDAGTQAGPAQRPQRPQRPTPRQ